MTTDSYELPPMPQGDGYMRTDAGVQTIYRMDTLREYALLAVKAERERCARVCEELVAFDMYDPGSTAAAAIRGA